MSQSLENGQNVSIEVINKLNKYYSRLAKF